MDRAILKRFAMESRKDLMGKIKNKIEALYIDEELSMQKNGEVYILTKGAHILKLSKEEYNKRELLIKRINELGLEQVIEEAAYTWFNRIVAIRYMEIHDYLPLTRDNQSLGVRVLSSKDNTPDPEIMKFTNLVNPELDIDFKKEKYVELKDDNEKFKYILLLVCRKLGRVIPQVFDGVTDYIDILIPDNLLNESGFVNKIITEVPEENYEQVEIIGWLYQYYNKTEKDRVISAKKAYKKNEIPYATQIFTPDWIVKYMVENSLGRYWIEHGGNIDLIKNWKYFINDNLDFKEKELNVAEVNKMTVKDLNAILAKKLTKLDPKDIKCIDPCCGSGHILVYMFEVLFQIYESYGYSKKNIAELILENNLYGLDIDDRAGQLSVLSVLLKAREYDKNIFNKKTIKNLNIMNIQETNSISIEAITNSGLNKEATNELVRVVDLLRNAKEIGSLLLLETQKYDNLKKDINELETIFSLELKEKLEPIMKMIEILQQKYDIIVTNPPYMNNSVMPNFLKKYISKYYPSAKGDAFSSFMIRNILFSKENSYLSFMTPYVWMFISSYEDLRKYIINNLNISSLIQLEYSALDEATVPICTFVLKNTDVNNYGKYFRLVDFKGGMKVQEQKYLELLSKNSEKYTFMKQQNDFYKIDGCPIAYWLSKKMIHIYDNGKPLNSIASPRKGNSTSNNAKFLRLWFEVAKEKIKFNAKEFDIEETNYKRWFPYNKGGGYRKWYGNNEYLIDWKNDAEEIRKCPTAVIANYQYFLKPGLTWSTITSSNFSIRIFERGFIFDNGGCCIFDLGDKKLYILALLNSIVFKKIFGEINPTLNFQSGEISKFPIIFDATANSNICNITNENIKISKEDWDSFETSWDFMAHPLVRYKEGGKNLDKLNYKIKDAYESWNLNCDEKFKLLKNNEEKLNRMFIDIYGLNDELTPEVDSKDITIRKADKLREIKSLISYAVGCMFGRYSLDENGLIYAGGKFDETKYKKFKVDSDNIIPITDETYFDDDIVQRFKKFIEVAFGKETLNENLDFIAETLGKKGTETSVETIRKYFVNDFFNDHCKIYQKRPIYWLLDSGKKNGFKALIYMHRYNENLIPKARLDYLHRIQTTYEKLLSDVNYKLTTDLSMVDKKDALKRQADLNAKLQEIKEYDEKIAHIANQRISIDLDDGVKVNYEKFKDILGRIK